MKTSKLLKQNRRREKANKTFVKRIASGETFGVSGYLPPIRIPNVIKDL